MEWLIGYGLLFAAFGLWDLAKRCKSKEETDVTTYHEEKARKSLSSVE